MDPGSAGGAAGAAGAGSEPSGRPPGGSGGPDRTLDAGEQSTQYRGLVAVVREFALAIVSPGDLPDLLHRLTDHARGVVAAAGAGILVEDRAGRLQFAAASDDRIVEIERHQQRIEDGACYDAYAGNRIMAIADLEAEARWPSYRARALAAGLRAVLAVPVRAYGRTVGVVNVYRGEPTEWGADDQAFSEVLAALAAGYLVHADHGMAQQQLTDNLQRAIDTRDLIGQAKGVIMQRHGVDADAAFALLRTWSQHHNRKLREVAQDVVAGTPLD